MSSTVAARQLSYAVTLAEQPRGPAGCADDKPGEVPMTRHGIIQRSAAPGEVASRVRNVRRERLTWKKLKKAEGPQSNSGLVPVFPNRTIAFTKCAIESVTKCAETRQAFSTIAI